MEGYKYLPFIWSFLSVCYGSLYPRESTTREVKSLNGIWNFRYSKHASNEGFEKQWFREPLSTSSETIPMAVPSSFNDITQSKTLRDYVGWVWYDRTFYAHHHWQSKNVILRFGSVNYEAVVFVNGVNVVNHTGGHLPFQVNVNKYVKYNEVNLITVAVNNTLTPGTLPQGSVHYPSDRSKYPKGFHSVDLNFDFFNYAGIHRNVDLYAIPAQFIEDVTLESKLSNERASLLYNISHSGCFDRSKCTCGCELWDKNGIKLVSKQSGCVGQVDIKNPDLWWPFKMSETPGYMYTVKTKLYLNNTLVDEYILKTGLRSVELKDNGFLINGKPVYFQGFGKHEDSHIRGRGLDEPLIVKDFNLIKWLGANVFRTSHYPYSEEMMDQADALGIMVIDECPAVGLTIFDENMLEQHKRVMTELIQRDKNRPSVVMWSIANEPKSQRAESAEYFKKVVEHVKELDRSRPVTAAINAPYQNDHLAQFLDVIMVNRYFGWYSDTGHVEMIKQQTVAEFENWHNKHNKLVLISEYGADTVAGLHQSPAFIFTEDYQVEFMEEYHKAFDILRKKGFFIGEMLWNFADFMTNQGITRVFGNRKGILTRERHPKAAAYVIRHRYWREGDERGFCYRNEVMRNGTCTVIAA